MQRGQHVVQFLPLYGGAVFGRPDPDLVRREIDARRGHVRQGVQGPNIGPSLCVPLPDECLPGPEEFTELRGPQGQVILGESAQKTVHSCSPLRAMKEAKLNHFSQMSWAVKPALCSRS